MDQFTKLDLFKNHVNSAMGVFAFLELSSEKCEAIHLLQNVVKTLESSLIQIDDEKKQHDGNVGKLTFQGVGKFATCQDIRKRTCQNEIHHSGTDVSIQEPPGIQEKLAPELNTEHEKKDESSLEWNTTRMQKDKPVRSADVDVTKIQNITRENNHLKEELWKLVSVSGEHPLVTPGSDTSAPMIVGNVLDELISKAVFFVELSHGPVEVVDLVQRHLATVAPVVVVAKRKRGRPPRNKPLSPAPSIPAQPTRRGRRRKDSAPSIPAQPTRRGRRRKDPAPSILAQPTRRGRRRKDPRIIGMMQCLAQGEELLREGRKRKTTGDSADGESNTRGTKLHKTSGKYLVSAPEEDCTGRDIKTDVVPSGAIVEEANADSDTTVIYDEATDSDASLQKQQSTERMKRELKLKAKFRSKMPAMSARHKCEICRAAFSHGRPFKRHLLKHGEGDVSCQRCHDEFQNYALFLHHQCRGDPASRLRRGIEQKCTLCAEMFHNRKKLQHHMNVVHNRKLDPVFFCEYCNKGFVKQASLYVHYKQHADGQHVCTKCGRFFEDEKAFAMHENTHAGCRKYTCKKCEETFTRRQQYMQHLDGHKKYDCLMCGQKFSTNKMLEQHNKNIHGIELKTKMYGCDYCGKKYPRPGLLELHLRTHTGEKPLECGPCCLFFRTPKALYRHRQTFGHMQKAGLTKKERSHLCATCGRSYFRKQALDRHMRYHSGIKPHQCPHCSYETREHNNLKRHIALHFSRRDFICETCGDAFHAKKTLEVHVLYKHSDERPLQCTDCEMTFKTKNSLKRHRLIHQNLRLHKCAICEMSFNRFYNLRRHMRMVHGTEDPLPAPNKVRVLDAPAGQEYRRPYRPPIKRSSHSVDTVPSGVSHNQLTVDPAENPVSLCEGSSMDHPRANPKHYTNLVPSTPEGANLVQLLPVIRHVPTITPSMLPQVNYVPISAAISDAIGGATVAVPHQLVGASTMTTMQGLYHPPQPLLHPQAPPRQPTDPLQPPHTSISANISQDNQPDFSSMDIYSNLLRLMHPPCS